jgi:hypothetical protein
VPGKLRPSAGSVIADALGRARAASTSQIGEEQLFAALLGNPDSGPLFGRVGEPGAAEAVWAEVREARRRGGLTAGEEQALAGLGIDLDEVVARVEAQLGTGALDGTALPARRRRVSVSADVHAVLAEAQRHRIARGDRGLTAQHLALAVVTRPSPLADALSARGVTAVSMLEAMGGGRPEAAPR